MKSWLKAGLIGFIIGLLILFIIFIITYIPTTNSIYEEKSARYLTFSDCRECSLIEKSDYECAWEVMKKNSNGRFVTDVEKFREDEEVSTENSIINVKQKCAEKTINELKEDIYFLGIDIGTVAFSDSEREELIKRACNNPKLIVRELNENAFYETICPEGSFLVDIFDTNRKKMEVGEQPTFRTTFFNRNTFGRYNDMMYNIGGYYIGPLWLIIYYLIVLLPLEGAIINIFINRRKKQEDNLKCKSRAGH